MEFEYENSIIALVFRKRNHLILKGIIVPCYNEKEILYAMSWKIFLFFFEYFWVLSWDKIKVYFKMQQRAEFLNKKFHFNFEQFFSPEAELYEMSCKRWPYRIEKGLAATLPFFAVKMVGSADLILESLFWVVKYIASVYKRVYKNL